jgi:Mg-chelatase subunit ChlD
LRLLIFKASPLFKKTALLQQKKLKKLKQTRRSKGKSGGARCKLQQKKINESIFINNGIQVNERSAQRVDIEPQCVHMVIRECRACS